MYTPLRNAMVVGLLAVSATPALAAEAWYATRTLLPGDIVREDDIMVRTPQRPLPDLLPPDRPVAGLEVKRRVYADRALTERDVGPRSAVKVNTPVQVLWRTGALTLSMQGKALESGAVGDEIRILNTASNRTVRGTVAADGVVEVKAVP
jgi:flagella basal body P-ring formation protein FlgA